jgi:Tol biopolymer transport system component
MKPRRVQLVSIVTALVVAVTPGPVRAAEPAAANVLPAGGLVRVSLASNGAEVRGITYASLSADGRHVVFESSAPDLVRGDTNDTPDVFVKDLRTGVVRRASVSTGGAQANGPSYVPAVSADGRYVLFSSGASNLVRSDTNNAVDTFLRDIRTGRTSRVSVSARGVQGDGGSWSGCLSPNGRYASYASNASTLVPGPANEWGQVYVRDLRTGRTTRASVSDTGVLADAETTAGCPTDDGRSVVFNSSSARLVAGDTNDAQDVFVRDLRAGHTTRVSVTSAGRQVNGASTGISLTRDGRYLALGSSASNLVPGDTNGFSDMFVRDMRTGTVRLVSRTAAGGLANGHSGGYTVSADGRFVAFESRATNLVPGDTNERSDVFVRDLRTGRTSILSVAVGGGQSGGDSTWPTVSADGRRVLFSSGASFVVPGDGNGTVDAFLADTGRAVLPRVVPQGNRDSSELSLSPDGRYAAFASFATNLVRGDTNQVVDLFVRDLRTGATTRASVANNGAQVEPLTYLHFFSPTVSDGGRVVAFNDDSTKLVRNDPEDYADAFARDTVRRTTVRASVPYRAGEGVRDAYTTQGSLSRDGRYLAFSSSTWTLVPGDTNGRSDVFVRDLRLGRTVRASVRTGGTQALGGDSNLASMSPSGRYLTFASRATNLVPGDTNGTADMFLRDLTTGVTSRVSVGADGAQGNGESGGGDVSSDGRYVAFVSSASNLVAGDTNGTADVFVRDLRTGTTRRASVATGGGQGDQPAQSPAISDDGRFVVFLSWADNLVRRDTNQIGDVFVRDLRLGRTARASVASDGTQGTGPQPCACFVKHLAGISADGRYVAFSADQDNLVPGDTNQAAYIFVHDLRTHTTTRP